MKYFTEFTKQKPTKLFCERDLAVELVSQFTIRYIPCNQIEVADDLFRINTINYPRFVNYDQLAKDQVNGTRLKEYLEENHFECLDLRLMAISVHAKTKFLAI